MIILMAGIFRKFKVPLIHALFLDYTLGDPRTVLVVSLLDVMISYLNRYCVDTFLRGREGNNENRGASYPNGLEDPGN